MYNLLRRLILNTPFFIEVNIKKLKIDVKKPPQYLTLFLYCLKMLLKCRGSKRN